MKNTTNAAEMLRLRDLYVIAREAHELALAAYIAACDANGGTPADDATDEECERAWAIADALRAEHDVDAFADLRREAEVAMVEMAFTIAAEYARATGGSLDVAETMRAAQRRPSAWERAVDTAAKLAA